MSAVSTHKCPFVCLAAAFAACKHRIYVRVYAGKGKRTDSIPYQGSKI